MTGKTGSQRSCEEDAAIAKEERAMEENVEGGIGREKDIAGSVEGEGDAGCRNDGDRSGEGPTEDDGKKHASGGRNRELGAQGEDAAALFLERRGYEILERNWRCPAGEADVIARDEDGSVVFVEVKTRRGVKRGFPSEAVTAERRRRYERIAGWYLSEHVFEDVRVRFDVIGILSLESEGRMFIRHHVDAFGVDL